MGKPLPLTLLGVIVMQFFTLELSISQEIGLSIFLHQHYIRGQTIQFIHKNTLANYHRLLIYHPPLEWAFKACFERRMHGLHWHASLHLLRIFSSKTQLPTILVSRVSF
jgi:hypothetical protein